jgi:hypothetical protein
MVRAGPGPGGMKHVVLTVDPGWTVDKPAPTHVASKWMVIGKDCKEKEAAGLFIEEQVSPEAQLINARIAAELPSRKDP